MPVFDRVLVGLMACTALVAVAGLAARYRASACWSFTAYLASTATIDGLLAASPSTLWTWPFLLATDILQTALRAACAVEITDRTFRGLPGGRAQVRWILLGSALLILAAVAFWPGRTETAFDQTLVVARVTYGVAFLFVAYLRLTSYYHLPVDPVHRDVAIGFVVLSVLVAFTQPLSALDQVLGWGRDTLVKLSYLLLLLWWARRAWAREEVTALTREVMERLQPWRVKRIVWK